MTDKDTEPGLRDAIDALQRMRPDVLPAAVLVDHFGNLRGKNQYKSAATAVYFTHLYRKPDEFYLGLGSFSCPASRATHGNGPARTPTRGTSGTAPRRCCTPRMVCDLYQDLMRINIRRDPTAKATVFLPTGDPRIITRVLRLMRGVALVLPDGREVQRPTTQKVAA